MRAPPVAALLLLAVLFLAACGDGTGPQQDAIPPELAATWAAEPACLAQGCGIVLSAVANPADSINITAAMGMSTEIAMTRSGVFRLTVRPGPDTAMVGTVRAAGAALIVTDRAGVVDTIDYQLAGADLHLRWRRSFSNDLLGAAHMRGTFRRR
jgi:hypothetical protein